MNLRSLGLLALGAATANAFRDTSPFFLASTSEYVSLRRITKAQHPLQDCGLELWNIRANEIRIRVLVPSSNIALATSLLNDISSNLKSCPSDYYVVASQPGVHSTDFSTRKSAPRLGAKMTGKDKAIRSTASVHQVAGVMDAKEVQNMIGNACGAEATVIDASSECTPGERKGTIEKAENVELTICSWLLPVFFWRGSSCYHG